MCSLPEHVYQDILSICDAKDIGAIDECNFNYFQCVPGQYLFIETSAPQKPFDKAWVMSEKFQPTTGPGRCMSFWAHMYGTDIGAMRVKLYDQAANQTCLLWEIVNDRGDKWFSATVAIQSSTPYYVSETVNE